MVVKATDLTVRPVQLADCPALLSLWQRVFGPGPWWTEEFFCWQYFNAPAGPAIMRAAFHAEKCVGVYSIVPAWAKVTRRRARVALTVGSATDADYRTIMFRDEDGLNVIFTKLARLAYRQAEADGIALTYGFPNPLSYPGFVKLLGFRDIGTLTFMARPVHLRGLLSMKWNAPSWLSSLAGGLAQAAAAVVLPSRVEDDPEVETRDMLGPDPALDELADAAAAIHPNIRIRDRSFVQWRFFDCPWCRYRVLGAYRRGRLAGYLVWLATDRHDRTTGTTAKLGHIVDYLAPPDQAGRSCLPLLLRAAGREIAREQALATIAVTSPIEYVRHAFRQAGYVLFDGKLSPRKFPCIVRAHDPAIDPHSIENLHDWYFTFADNDVT
jgi:hypothetical protein